MKDVVFDHIFECDPDTYWDKIFFDEEYNQKLFLEELKFEFWKQEIVERTDAVVRRVMHMRPPVGDVPATVRKVLGDRFGYKEHGTFDRVSRRYHIKVEPSASPEKTNIFGELWLEKVAERRVRRVAKIFIEVRIVFIGGIIEDRILADTARSYNRTAGFTNTWIRERGL